MSMYIYIYNIYIIYLCIYIYIYLYIYNIYIIYLCIYKIYVISIIYIYDIHRENVFGRPNAFAD